MEIVDFRPAWSEEFRAIAEKLRAELGSSAVRIDHIGSTAVPGLAAKDILDIQITVADLENDLPERLAAVGYSHVRQIERDHGPPESDPDVDEWRKQFYRAPIGQRPTNTHVRVAGRANQRYALLFRDYLRAHSATAAAYSRLKRQLAQHLRDVDCYPDVKDPAVDLIYFAAEAWASVTGWRAGPSDA